MKDTLQFVGSVLGGLLLLLGLVFFWIWVGVEVDAALQRLM